MPTRGSPEATKISVGANGGLLMPRAMTAFSWRADVACALVVGLVALGTRLMVAISVPDTPPISDMAEYWERAVYVFEHGRLYENSFRTPGYPVALALAFGLGSGPSLIVARLLNVIAGVLTALLTYWLARRTASVRASAAAALAVALYPSLVMHTAVVATEALVMVPLVAALIAATYEGRRASVAAGLLVGLTVLIRPSGIALLPAVLVACMRRPQSKRSDTRGWSFVTPALVLIAFSLTLSPWWLHNARLHGRFIPLDTGFGVNLMIGNGPHATGVYESNVLGSLVTAPDSRTPEGSDRLVKLAMAHVWAYPLETLALVPVKMRQFFAIEWRDPGLLYSWSYFGPLQPGTLWLLGVIVVSAFPLLLTAASIGASIRQGVVDHVLVPSLLFGAATIGMHVILFGEARYHLPLVPVLAVLATGLSRWRAGMVPWRVAVVAVMLTWLSVAAWFPQVETFRTIMPRLAASDGWASHLAYDVFLQPKR